MPELGVSTNRHQRDDLIVDSEHPNTPFPVEYNTRESRARRVWNTAFVGDFGGREGRETTPLVPFPPSAPPPLPTPHTCHFVQAPRSVRYAPHPAAWQHSRHACRQHHFPEDHVCLPPCAFIRLSRLVSMPLCSPAGTRGADTGVTCISSLTCA